MKKNKFTWKTFWIRQFKLHMPMIVVCYLLWNAIEFGHVTYEYFGWTLEGYGPPQQRWYRVIASGFILICLFGTFIDAINTWHYLKNPDEIPKNDSK